MSERPKDSLIERIKKLLAKTTEAGATEAEAQSAAAMAQRLMDEHNISAAQVNAEGPGQYGQGTIWEGEKMQTRHKFVIPILEEVFAVRGVLLTTCARNPKTGRTNTLGGRIVLFGDEANASAAAFAFVTLSDAFTSFWLAYRAEFHAPQTAMRPYFAGLQAGFMDRLEAQRRQTRRDIPGAANALALCNDRLDQAFAEQFPNVQTKQAEVKDDLAFTAGYLDSARLTLDKGVSQAQPRALANGR